MISTSLKILDGCYPWHGVAKISLKVQKPVKCGKNKQGLPKHKLKASSSVHDSPFFNPSVYSFTVEYLSFRMDVGFMVSHISGYCNLFFEYI